MADEHGEIMDTDSWIKDYGNEWEAVDLQINILSEGYSDRKPIKTFREYVLGRVYSGQECNLESIPQGFIHQSDRLVRIYNNFISRDELDIERMKRVIGLAKKVIYKKHN
jgi:hypothetical protein